MVLVAGGAAAEWLRAPSPVPVWIAWACVLAAVLLLWPVAGWRRRALALLLLALAGALTISERQLKSIENRWEQEREDRVTSASQRLDRGDLHSALHRAEHLAEAAIATSADDQAGAFRVLDRLVPTAGPEMSVVVFDPQGHPWAWAGRHRLPPQSEGDSIASRSSGYYVVLEARRHSADGRSAVAGVLIWAHPAVPDRGRSLAELFRSRTGVGLTIYPPGSAPNSPDIYDYKDSTSAGPRLFFSVQPVPPEQGSAKQLAYHHASRWIVWLVLLTAAVALSLTVQPVERFLLLAMLLWLAARAPVGSALGLRPLFSPATFFGTTLGVLSSSAGVLGLAGILLTMAGVWLWRRRPPRRWYGVLIGVALLLAAPYLISSLGRGITPPSRGVSMGLWLTWQLTLLVSVSALIIAAAALFRGNGPETHTRWRIVARSRNRLRRHDNRGVDLEPARWLARLVHLPLDPGAPARDPARAALVGDQRYRPRRRKLRCPGHLGSRAVRPAAGGPARCGPARLRARSPRRAAAGALRAAGAPCPRHPPAHRRCTRSGTAHHSVARVTRPISGCGRNPVSLVDELTLDSLDLPHSLLSTMVRNLPSSDSLEVTQLIRIPGVHYVLLSRVSPERVMTASVGPRSELIMAGRVGRLLDPSRHGAPLYSLTLSPPAEASDVQPGSSRWRREGWALRSEYPLDLLGSTRTVHAAVDLRGPLPLLVRGVLVVLFDAAVLGLLWFVAELVAGAGLPRPRWRSLARSFRIRLAVTLGAFFILPAVGFSAWSFARLADEAERSRDLLITQTLRDAVLSAGGILRSGAPPEERLSDLSRRIDADLALYQGGTLAGTSTPVLKDLGVTGQLMDPDAYQALALEGELEITQDGSIPQLAERVGYRVVQPGSPSDIGVLATPQLADDPLLGVRQLDLALVLLLATLAGVAAALAGARIAARTLSRPVAELRRSALALGKGEQMPHRSERPPLEFEPVFAAFERMAADIRTSQSALEDARRRTSTVLATVATGVVGLDPRGRVLIANRQAVDLLGTRAGGGRAVPRAPRRRVGSAGRCGAKVPGRSGRRRNRRAGRERPEADATARVAGPGCARRGHGAQRCHRHVSRGTSTGVG